MPVILAQNLKRKYSAPAGSGAHIFVMLINISVIIAAFLIAYYSGGMSRHHSNNPQHICVDSTPIILQYILCAWSSQARFLSCGAGLWVKEKSYREQPIVNFKRAFAARLQGIDARSSEPFELVYRSLRMLQITPFITRCSPQLAYASSLVCDLGSPALCLYR